MLDVALNVALKKQMGTLSLLQKRIAIGSELIKDKSFLNEGEKNDFLLPVITFERLVIRCPVSSAQLKLRYAP